MKAEGRILAAALVAAGALFQLGAGHESTGTPEERGLALFVAHRCGDCHSTSATPGATGRVLPLENLSERYTPKLLAELLEAPPPEMPRVSLTAEEREALAAFLLGLEKR